MFHCVIVTNLDRFIFGLNSNVKQSILLQQIFINATKIFTNLFIQNILRDIRLDGVSLRLYVLLTNIE